jgi:hypothetical protein
MAVEYTNRRGDTYYLQAGKTPTGKPRYWFGRRLTGEQVEAMPAGYEVCEHPERGLVSLRKMRPTEISRLDRNILSDGIRRYAALEHFIVDVDGDSLVVYLPDMGEDEADRVLSILGGLPLGTSSRMRAARTQMIQTSTYQPVEKGDWLRTDRQICQQRTAGVRCLSPFSTGCYAKMMRFVLVNPDERMFVVYRWCFRGSIDDWIWVGGPAPLTDLVRDCGQHLGKESFYELM